MNPRRVNKEDKIAFVLVMDIINPLQLFIFTNVIRYSRLPH